MWGVWGSGEDVNYVCIYFLFIRKVFRFLSNCCYLTTLLTLNLITNFSYTLYNKNSSLATQIGR